MRIITGSAKGTRLKTPRGMETRPTSDRVKESVFNILGPFIANTNVLDLFAGTGNLGLEALSRGAASALFIDKSSASVNLVRDNIDLTKFNDRAVVLKSDVFYGLDWLIKENKRFELIFCDPPYNKGLVEMVLTKIDTSNILSVEGIIVVEHSNHEQIRGEFNQLKVKRTEKYGETLVSFLTL
ncbi:MAG: 16S rRNA (guanine(966)-N(2))-methyltransferase RsmD [Veillonellaceae bacterium]|jgi:16S rRNA (guanine966-N2)-methyltransferase|nr:16S rRNA (guanine(966)-N(2))-methyltransferase RsmD [Veillonellaceae bacterium]